VHTSIQTFFSWAKARSFLPKSEATEAEAVSKVKVGGTEKGRVVPNAEEECRADAFHAAQRALSLVACFLEKSTEQVFMRL
jgi:hypothetical protein